MKLDQLLSATEILSIGGALENVDQIIIDHLAYDSRKVLPGTLFFLLPSQVKKNSNAHISFVKEAIAQGALAVLSQEEIPNLSVPLLRVRDSRAAMGDLAASFYGHPSHSLMTCGVTGTNGKTTTTFLIRHLLEACGRFCGLMGTIEYVLPGVIKEASRTTPESVDVQEMMCEMKEGGFKAVAMEVSSHAMVQERVRKIEFDVAVFTNLTQDHLDYHGSMDDYFNAKALLFERLTSQSMKRGRAVINADDRYAHLLMERLPSHLKKITFGQSSNATFRARDIHYNATGTIFRLDARGRSYLVRSPFIGLFNVYNVLAALASAASMGIELRRAVKAVASVPQVPGRLQRVLGKRNFQVFVDYAHTPDALENVLRSLRQLQPHRIIVVFGCGGDRDRSKRPLMAAAVEPYADEIIVTTDNPRSEEPSGIIADIVKGFRRSRHECIIDREEAIVRAIDAALPDDIVLIAGKGHETYQEVAGVRHPFNDAAIAQRAMNNKVQ